MRIGRNLRRAVLSRLIAEVPALAGRAYDRATETDDHPYVTLGPSYWTDASVQCIPARSMTLQIDVWCSSGAATGKGNAEDVIDDVAAALKGWRDPDMMAVHPAEIYLVRVMDDPSGSVHGVVQIKVLAEG